MKLLALILLVVSTYGVSAQKTMVRGPKGGGGGGGGTKCSTPSGLSTSNITISSATANWSPVSGAISYNVDYKQSSSGTWINIASGTSSLSWNLSGLPASTSFDWRVRTNCSSGSSGYTQTTFSTLSQTGGGGGGSCNAPTGLATSNIMATSATATWAPVSGAVSYNLDYKLASSPTWITISPGGGTTSLQWTIGGLQATTSYDWRVSANCSSGVSSYTQTQFTSQAIGSCSAPGGLYASPASTTATLSWSPVSGVIAYTVQYKPASSGSWIYATSGTYETFVNLYSVSANTTYDWRVYSNCSLSEVSGYSYGQFTTSGGATKASATTTATMENANPNFTINLFPNPAGDQLNVWVDGVHKKTDIKVYNLMGKLIMQQESGNTLTQLNISKLSAGLYLMHVNDGKETRSARFVKN